MAVAFHDLTSASGLKKLDEYLLSWSYISGYQASKDDIIVHAAITKAPSAEYVNVSRWYSHIEALLRISGVAGEGCGVIVEGSGPITEEAVATPPAGDSKATAADEDDDDDDDVDLFGEETEEEKKASEERAAAAKASGKKKESGKSSVLLDVKPWDDETDMKKLEEAVRNVTMEGLLWGASKLMPVGYGIKKLQIMMTIVDDLVSVDSLIEEHLTEEPVNEYVQSCDIVAFNKICFGRGANGELSFGEYSSRAKERPGKNCDMNNNTTTQPKIVGYPTHFMTPGAMAGPVPPQPPNPQPHHHLLSQSHTGPPHFPGHFQLSEPQVHALAQSQFITAQAQANAQAAQAQFQAQIQAQAQAQSLAPSPPVPTPPGPTKRPNPRPPTRAPSSSSNPNNPNLPFKTMELTPAATRRKKRARPDPRTVPEKLAPILPESALYTQLLEYEARLDAAVARQKADIHESFRLSPQVQRTLRIYVFNTFSASPDPPGWSLRIVGRLLEEGKDPAVTSQNPNPAPKFSTFFKKITIQLDRTLYPDDNVILWENSRSSAHQEGFEVKRKGDKEFPAVIRLEMNYSPEKFKLSPTLSEALGIEVDTRARVMAAIWHYVKARKLQVPTDPSTFVCDPFLHRAFGEERMKFASVPAKLSQHLTPPDPICLEHEIKLSGVSPAGTICYDVLVDVPLRIEGEMARFFSNCDKSKEIDSCDELISSAFKKIAEHRRRRAFFLGFSQSPAEFINTLITSQSKDLKLVAGDGSRNVDKESRSEFYNQPWVEDAVIRYLNRKSAGTDTPGAI